MRTSRYLFSERFSPWMRGSAELARVIEQHRSSLPADNALLVRERSVSGQVFNASEDLRKGRDAEEQIFTLAYGAALGAAAAGAAG